MERRYIEYNKIIDMINEMQKRNEIFVIRPSDGINVRTIERNPNKLQTVYDLGVADCRKQLEKLRYYLR